MRRLAPAAGLLAAAFALAGCSRPGGPGSGSGPAAWERVDLWSREPAVDASPFANPAKEVHRAAVGYLGAWEVRDLSRVPPTTFELYPHQPAGQVRVIEQAAGSRLAWRLTLGAEPYLSFTPLLDERNPCPACLLRVGVRDTGGLTEVFQVAPESPSPLAPPPVRVDLSPWAGETVELLAQVDGPRGGWARWASPAVYGRRPAAPPPGSPERPNVLLVGIDTLRADHVGAYRTGGEPPWTPPSLTPALDRLAGESDLWLDAYATFNVTSPSFASILTGLYGKNHGVYGLKTPLPPAHHTLAEAFDEAGYDTLAVISASHLGDHNSGLGQGFDAVVQATEHAAAELAVETAMDWIAGRREEPFFVWLHLFDPHTPHTPPRPFDLGFRLAEAVGLGAPGGWIPFRSPGPVVFEEQELAAHRALYAGEVAYLDHQVGRLLDFLSSRGLLETTIVALVSDHGENLGDHGILHRHIGLWETTLEVPMMIRWPGEERSGRRLTGLVQTLDLYPTLLAAAGLPAPPSDGVPLDRLTGDGRRGRRAAFAEHAHGLGVRVRADGHSLMRSAGNPHVPDGAHLYALADDPAEERDLAGRGLAEEPRLAEALDRWLADRRPAPGATSRELSPEEEERLRALGYLE